MGVFAIPEYTGYFPVSPSDLQMVYRIDKNEAYIYWSMAGSLTVGAISGDSVLNVNHALTLMVKSGDIINFLDNAWVVTTAYFIGNKVRDGGVVYRCKLNHTSSALDEPGVGVNWATYWDVSFSTDYIVESADTALNTITLDTVLGPVLDSDYIIGTPVKLWVLYPFYVVPEAFRPNKTIARVRYAGRDFNTILDEIVAYLSQTFGNSFTDFVQSDLGMMFMELVAYACDGLSWYQDQQATESFLETAQDRNNVVRLARNVGYKVGSAVSASVDLEFTLGTPYLFTITIPKGFQVTDSGGLIFETGADTVFNAGSTTPVIQKTPAYEGQTIQETFVSTGLPNQEFTFKKVPTGKSVVRGTIATLVGVEVWTELDFIDFTQTKIYEIEYGAEPPQLLFGDGIAGLIPAKGIGITVTYVVGSGASGNVGSGLINALASPLVIGGNLIDLAVTNPFASTGGSDQPSLEHIKNLAPRIFRAQTVAVTKEDFDALSNDFRDPVYGAVGKAIAIIVRNIDSDTTLVAPIPYTTAGTGLVNRVYQVNNALGTLVYNYLSAVLSGQCKANHVIIYILTTDLNGYYASASGGLQTALANYLEPIKVMPITIEVIDAWNEGVTTFQANVAVDVKIDPNYVITDVKPQVLANIEARFKGREFGASLRLSDLFEDAEVAGVLYAHVVITQPPGDPNRITISGDMEVGEIEMIIPGTITVTNI